MQQRSEAARTGLHVRPAREADLDRLLTIHSAAFPDPRARDVRRRNFVENTRGSLADLQVAERDGAIVGHAFLFPLAVRIAGAEVPGGGVASLGVAPEARRTGVARGMMDALHAELLQRNAPLSLLYPFRHDFYGRLGYGTVGALSRLRVPASALPTARRAPEVRVGRVDDLAAMKRLYARVASRGTGFVTRREAVWRALVGTEGRQLAVVVGEAGELLGYLVFAYLWPPDGMPQELDVVELVAETDLARLALFSLLARQRDQSPWVRLLVAPDDPLVLALGEPRSASFDTIRALVAIAGEVGAGAMLRLVDVPLALSSRPWSEDGELGLSLRDGGANGTALDLVLRTRGGLGEVGPGPSPRRLSLGVATLAQLYAGALTASQAVRYGLADADRPDTAALADRLFATAPFFTWDVF